MWKGPKVCVYISVLWSGLIIHFMHTVETSAEMEELEVFSSGQELAG